MQLIVLGSGTSVPHPQRASAAFWLQTDGASILLDCSPDAAHRMAQENLDWPDLDAIWISHLHLDHCGGLASLLFGMKHAPQTQTRTKPLHIFGCGGVERLLTAIDGANDYGLLMQPFPLAVNDKIDDGEEFELAGLRARAFSTPHTRESLALRLTTKDDKSIVYSSDTGLSKDVAVFAHHADLLILECSFYREKPVQTHLTLEDAMQIAAMAEPRKLLLTHLYPEWDGIDIEARAREKWPGETIAARDGLRIEI
jgi:ribonuclease BN (tRNA processing enzyme)